MAQMKEASRKVLCKVVSSSLGKSSPKFLQKITQLEKHKGPVFVVKRLKALQMAALKIRSGNVDEASAILKSARIKCRKDKPFIPAGIEGLVVRNISESKKLSVVRRNLMITRSYTAFTLKQCTIEQFNKSKSSITSHPVILDKDECRVLGNEIAKVAWGYRNNGIKTLSLPSLSELSGTSRYPDIRSPGGKSVGKEPYLSLARSLLTKGLVPEPLLEHFGDFSSRKMAQVFQEYNTLGRELSYGKISFLQEGGCKARVVCQPNAWVQFYMKPLHNSLMRTIYQIESGSISSSKLHGQSCVIDQNRGGWVLKEALQLKKEVFCFDLSSATDRFPLSLQQQVLRGFDLNVYADSLSILKGPYDVNPKVTGMKPVNEQWTYEIGQPMGLYGSFPLFHLTHLAVLECESRRLNLQGNKNYCVLGDDVVITDRNLADRYLSVMRAFDVPISKDKSFVGEVSEFAGFLAIRGKANGIHVFRPFKWGNGFAVDEKEKNFMQNMGSPTLSLGSWWKKSYEIYSQTIPYRDLDLTPLVINPEAPGPSNKLGSRWFTAILSRGIEELAMSEDPLIFHLKNTWQRDSSQLLKGDEGLNAVFDPKQYLQEDRLRKKYSSFTGDPLIKQLIKESKQAAVNESPLTPIADIGLVRLHKR